MKKLFACIAFMLAGQLAMAQEVEEEKEAAEERGFRRENLFIGGTFGLTFGDYTLLNLSPQVGYRFNRFLAAGGGLNALYASYKERFTTGDPFRKESQGVVGLNLFGRVYPIRQFMLQVQPEINYVFGKERYYTSDVVNRERHLVPSLLAGGGLVLPSGNSAFIVSLMYDVLQKEHNPYGARPVLNFGYTFGLGGR